MPRSIPADLPAASPSSSGVAGPLGRRRFLALGALAAVGPLVGVGAKAEASPPADSEFFRDWLGTTLVRGRYFLTSKPNLLEGAETMLALGTRVGKFWFDPSRAAKDNVWNSQWPPVTTLTDLLETPYWSAVFAMPFRTLALIVGSHVEAGWRGAQPESYYTAIATEWERFAVRLLELHGNRDLTVILQNWEGDWQLRGTGEQWDPPPPDWRERVARFARRLAARQSGVSRARARYARSRLQLVHAVEVNRVADQWKGIPTVTEHVLPLIEVDLVSYSCYDAMDDGATLVRGIGTIRSFARTNGPFGAGAVYLGEIGIPENLRPERIPERWAELLGAARQAGVRWAIQWQLHCNEPDPRTAPHPADPLTDPAYLRGFWLLKPDGAPSQTGEYFRSLWRPGVIG
jgi:hypothetical protein